jgi:hypothetical protein
MSSARNHPPIRIGILGCANYAPSAVMTDATWCESGVDVNATATLYYADGRRAQISCGMDTAYHRRATIVGSAGVTEAEYLNHTGKPLHVPSEPAWITQLLWKPWRIAPGCANGSALNCKDVQTKTQHES